MTQADIKALAIAHGFDVAQIASAAAPWEAGDHLAAFVAAGHHGEMVWMETTQDRRSHPTAMWANAKSAIMLGVNYGPTSDPLQALKQKSHAAISVYAQGDDYHDVIKKRLKAFAGELHRKLKAEVKIFVDTAPLMEKPLAARAGLGWQGKHTNLVSRQFGSYLFLGSVLLDCDLPFDAPEIDHCGSCTACLDICPTNAFPAPYTLDARRCISYLTIEYAGHIPAEFREAMGNRIYGCDDCLAVCPWNKFAQTARETKLQAREELKAPTLSSLAKLDDTGFRALFAKNPIKRIGVDRFLRNVAVAMGNSGDPELIEDAKALALHTNPVVRGAAVWALRCLMTSQDFSALARGFKEAETDSQVLSEWTQEA